MIRVVNGNTRLSDELYCSIAYTEKILGRTANEVYGYSYSIVGNTIFQVYTPHKSFNGFITPLRRYIYLPDYNISDGFTEMGMPTPERVICDFLKYPNELGAGIYIADAITGYLEDGGDLKNVKSLMSILNIDESKLDYWLSLDLSEGSNMCAKE